MNTCVDRTVNALILSWNRTDIRELARKLKVDISEGTDRDRYYRVATRLHSLYPFVHRHISLISAISLDNNLPSFISVLELPPHTTLSTLLLHVLSDNTTCQLLYVFQSRGLPCDIFNIADHYIVHESTSINNNGAVDGWMIQGIDLNYRFNSIYIEDYSFKHSDIIGGWYVPSDQIGSFIDYTYLFVS